MASRKKARARAAAERTYTKESPLVIAGVCWREASYARRARWCAPLLRFVVDITPSYRSTKRGRASERQMRVGLMLCGLAFAVFSGTMGLALLGGVIAMMSTVVPVPESKKLRWKRYVASLGEPLVKRIPEPVELRFDGETVSLCNAGGLQRSVSLGEGLGKVRLHAVDTRLGLEFRPETGGRAARLWVLADRIESLGDELSSLPKVEAVRVPSPICVDTQDWFRLRDASR